MSNTHVASQITFTRQVLGPKHVTIITGRKRWGGQHSFETLKFASKSRDVIASMVYINLKLPVFRFW